MRMQSTREAQPVIWELCATVSEAFQLVGIAQRSGVAVQLTSVRVDPDGPHSACSDRLTHDDDAKIDGYIVNISCHAPAEEAARLRAEIEATVSGCLIPRH